MFMDIISSVPDETVIPCLDHNKTLKKKVIKLYNILALPVLLYGSKTWTIKARDTTRISAAGMKCMRRTADTVGQITKHIHKLQRS
jgi:hypothetical protein